MKWPRISHLPDSPGVSRDDLVLTNFDHFIGQEIIITEKLDGENCSLHYDCFHARSQDSAHHASRSWIKSYHASFKHLIPTHLQIVGENLYACHSIYYDQLTTYFYVFAIIDKNLQALLSIEQTLIICQKLGLTFVPILYRGLFSNKFPMPKHSKFGQEVEGYVLRLASEIAIKDFNVSIAKWVRPNHVITDDHWTKNWRPNKLV